MPSNIKDNVVFLSPRDYAGRERLASSCVRNLGLELPALVDSFDNAVERAYTAWPDRLYVIDKAGRIAYKSDPGPFGFDPRQVRAVLESNRLW